MRSLAFVLFGLAAIAAAAEPVVKFPGDVTRVKSPQSDFVVGYFDPGENAYGTHEYSLRLEYPGKPFREIGVFTRSVDVSWSASGESFFVTDYIGSNVTDCYAFRPDSKILHKISLTTVLTTQNREVDRLLGAVDHGYVGCSAWASPRKIRVIAEGHGDRGGKSRNWTSFQYTFDYDVVTGTATETSGKVSRGKY